MIAVPAVGAVASETANHPFCQENRTPNLRNDMYVASEALRLMKKSGTPQLSTADWSALDNYRKHIDNATKFIPTWVKVAVAMALGLGTMVGWKRIVVTVGVGGTMAANGSGLQWGTVRSLAMAWVLTLPSSIILSATLFWTFRQIL